MGTRKGARRGARRGAVDNTAVDNTAVHFAARFWRRKPCPWVQDFVAKVLNDEIRARSARHLVQSRSFAQMLENSVRRYQNRAVEAAQVIEELIQLARDLRAAARRGEDLGLSDDEVAFYDALEV